MSNLTTAAQDTSLELAVRGQNAITDLVARMEARLADEEGQTAAEYMGLVLVVAAVIAALLSANIGGDIVKKIKDAIAGIGGK